MGSPAWKFGQYQRERQWSNVLQQVQLLCFL